MNATQLYDQRLQRYVTALRNGKPDMVPIRPFVAEFTAVHAGYTCQQTAHDYALGFAAARKCAADYDWDAVVPNMIATWTGMTQAMGLRYYMTPGIDVPANVGHQYLEPPEDAAFMKADEYDALIADPTGFLYNVWLPRVAAPLGAMGGPVTYEHNLSLIKGGMAMMEFFRAWGEQERRLREETGTVTAIAGILKAPFDIIADKLRGYVGLCEDTHTQPEKVLAACEALAPHLLHVALTSSDPTGMVPVGFWMHRGCVPLVSPKTFEEIYWPTLKPIIEELWRHGRQTLFYAEGNWDKHLDAFATLPDRSIVYHVDQGDIFAVHRKLGHKFCLSGGIPNLLLSFGTEQQVRDAVRNVIAGVAQDGGYIMDASAIIQNDAKVAHLRAMTEATREFGVYSTGRTAVPPAPCVTTTDVRPVGRATRKAPGVCIPWEQKRAELPPICGDEALARRVWEKVDALGNMYIWQVLLSF